MSGDEPFTMTVELTRGTSTDDRDKQRVKVSAHDVEQLEHRVEAVRERMEQWADEFRAVQPDGRSDRRLDEDQRELGQLKADGGPDVCPSCGEPPETIYRCQQCGYDLVGRMEGST